MPETLVVQAEAPELTRVWDWANELGDRLELSQSTLFAVHLCLEEAVTNIVQYAFASDPEGGKKAADKKDVRLTFDRAGDAVIITIEDHGSAFDPLGVATPAMPATISEASIGGRGVHLMRQFTQHLAYERRDGTNRLTLRFAYP